MKLITIIRTGKDILDRTPSIEDFFEEVNDGDKGQLSNIAWKLVKEEGDKKYCVGNYIELPIEILPMLKEHIEKFLEDDNYKNRDSMIEHNI